MKKQLIYLTCKKFCIKILPKFGKNTKGVFDQHFECAAPKRWPKYRTHCIIEVLKTLFCSFTQFCLVGNVRRVVGGVVHECQVKWMCWFWPYSTHMSWVSAWGGQKISRVPITSLCIWICLKYLAMIMPSRHSYFLAQFAKQLVSQVLLKLVWALTIGH